MKKNILIGATALVLTGTALIGSSIYAATASTSSTGTTRSLGARNTTSVTASLSGTVSTEAMTALQALMDSHRTEMDALRSSSGTVTEEQRDALQTEFQTEMDALIAKYPELANAMPQMGKGGMMGGRGEMMGRGGETGQFGSGSSNLFSTLPTDVQDEVTAIQDKYHTQMEALRTQEKTEINAVLAAYPDVQTQFDSMMGMGGGRGGKNRMSAGSGTTAN